jgi:tRNA pseudouridine65 synthase
VSAGEEGFWADIPLGPEVKRVALDPNGLAALDKPEGVLSHPNTGRDEKRSLIQAPYNADDECFEWPTKSGPQRLWLINRLDSATSGIILVATGGDLAREVRAQFKRRAVRKTYEALVFGSPKKPSELWKDLLEVKKQAGKIRTVAGAGRLPAESQMTLLRSRTEPVRVSLLRLEPHTGRSHQLRVQCAKRGLPIVGDQTYGNFSANREFAKATGGKRLHLHSLLIAFAYEYGGRKFEFSAAAPRPPEFERFA